MDELTDAMQVYLFAVAAILVTSLVVHAIVRWGGGSGQRGSSLEYHATFATSYGIVTLATHYFDVHTSLLMGPIALIYGVAYLLHVRYRLRRGR